MPLFSIIIPTYNAEALIERSLLSIMHQKYDDYEVIIQDGRSKDDTLKKVKRIGEKYSHVDIRIFSEKDEGVYDAMNKAIKKANGNWLYFLGSDDYLLDKDVLQKVENFIKCSPEELDIVYGNVFSVSHNCKYDGEFNAVKLTKQNICHQAMFHNKNLFNKIGTYNLKYKILSDHEFNIRSFYNKNIKIKYIDLMIAYYEQGGLSTNLSYSDVNFANDYTTIIKTYGCNVLPIKVLKGHCASHLDFLKVLIRRALIFCMDKVNSVLPISGTGK